MDSLVSRNIYLTFMLLISVGCSAFTSHYDVVRHQNFTNLKAYHVKFIEDNTAGADKQWVEQDVRDYCSAGDLKFKEAYEYAKSKDSKDKTASKAVKYLHDQFNADCAKSLGDKKLFSATFAGELLPEIIKQYDYAIAGEESRVGG